MTSATNEPQAAEKHREAVLELLDIADCHDNPRPMDVLVPAIVHALLAIEDRLAHQPPPIYVLNSTGDVALDEATVERFRELVEKSVRRSA